MPLTSAELNWRHSSDVLGTEIAGNMQFLNSFFFYHHIREVVSHDHQLLPEFYLDTYRSSPVFTVVFVSLQDTRVCKSKTALDKQSFQTSANLWSGHLFVICRVGADLKGSVGQRHQFFPVPAEASGRALRHSLL